MNIKYINNNTVVSGLADFELAHIFDCGQCFRFDPDSENTYLGVAFGKVLRIAQEGDTAVFFDTAPEDFHSVWYDYFDLGRDYGAIKQQLSENDPFMRQAVKYGGGIRILRQELWETTVSFIISQSNNIPRIKGIIERLCEHFGDEIPYRGKTYYSFPSFKKIAALDRDDLALIRAGYRDKYILSAARAFNDSLISSEIMNPLTSAEAKNLLMSVKGIGRKVSDCITLFGLGKADSFPVDVWIKRIMEYCYFNSEQPIKVISEFAEKKFGSYGGYAQQYLFFYARENKIGV